MAVTLGKCLAVACRAPRRPQVAQHAEPTRVLQGSAGHSSLAVGAVRIPLEASGRCHSGRLVEAEVFVLVSAIAGALELRSASSRESRLVILPRPDARPRPNRAT